MLVEPELLLITCGASLVVMSPLLCAVFVEQDHTFCWCEVPTHFYLSFGIYFISPNASRTPSEIRMLTMCSYIISAQ